MTFYGQKRRTELFCQKRPTNIFATVAGKQLCWCLFLIKVAGWILRIFLEHLYQRTSPGDCFSDIFIFNLEYILPNIQVSSYTANIHLLKVNNRNTRKRYEICWKLSIKTVERRHCHGSVFLLLTLNMFQTFFLCFYC